MSYGCLGMFGSGGMTLGLYQQVHGRPGIEMLPPSAERGNLLALECVRVVYTAA